MNVNHTIKNKDELEFAVFCIENIAIRLKAAPEAVYNALTEQSDILNRYIVPNYDVLHTQGKDYIINDILEVMKNEGVSV
ncbi:MAG: DUF3791 domain-containing protein [Acutalibacteraceae bacterium]|nr:DUF3791 domain-containing protein [Bacillota bacterium]